MSYIKYGIVTKIKIVKNDKQSEEYIKNNFNLNLYIKEKNTYYLKEEILNENIKKFRTEFLELTNNEGDSLNNCEAFCLETTANKLLKNKIFLCQNNEKFYFSKYEDFKFETDNLIYKNKKVKIKIYFVSVFWDINRIQAEDFSNISNIINKLTRISLKNTLKDASFFTIV